MLQFPSPYGVSFILMKLTFLIYILTNFNYVSVSLRSIIHSYSLTTRLFIIRTLSGFRLLTEYHSFLCKKCIKTLHHKCR